MIYKRQNWTPEEEAFVIERSNSGEKPSKIVKKLNKRFKTERSRKSVAHKIDSMRSYDEISATDLLIRSNQNLQSQLAKEKEKTQVLIDTVHGSLAKLRVGVVKAPKMNKTKHDEEMHLLRSDAHVGKVVTSSLTQGIGDYNTERYIERLHRWRDKVLLFKSQDKGLGLNKCVISHLGDQVDNETIYPGHSFHIDMPVVDQVMVSLESEYRVLLELAQVFNKIEIFCVPGNHGRPGKKGENHPKSTWDYIFYKFLKILTANQPNIEIFISEGPSIVVQHHNFNFFYSHGSNVRFFVGMPWYGIDRNFRRLSNLYGMVFDYQCLGHVHTPSTTPGSFTNGSFAGGDNLSINQMMLSSRPSQKMFYLDPDEGPNRVTELYLTDQVELTSDKNGIFTEYS